MEYQEIFKFENGESERIILGTMNHHLDLISTELKITLIPSAESVLAEKGIDTAIVVKILDILNALVKKGVVFKERDVLGIIKMAKHHEKDNFPY